MTAAVSSTLLAQLPDGLRGELLDRYSEIERNFRERRWEPSELNGGKFCEVVYSILNGYVSSNYPNRASKPANMADACRALERLGATNYPRSIVIQIPRMLIGLYEIRSNRGVGHVGGDVDPNEMDAVAVLSAAKWILAELIRFFHGVSTQQATDAISALVQRTVPEIWEVANTKRVLRTSLSTRDQTLLLLYHEAGASKDSDLCKWVEYSNPSLFRSRILGQAHDARYVEYDRKSGMVHLSPVGVKFVEDKLL